jgi:hypothetical protein
MREIYITTHKRGYDDESRPYTVTRRRPAFLISLPY